MYVNGQDYHITAIIANEREISHSW